MKQSALYTLSVSKVISGNLLTCSIWKHQSKCMWMLQQSLRKEANMDEEMVCICYCFLWIKNSKLLQTFTQILRKFMKPSSRRTRNNSDFSFVMYNKCHSDKDTSTKGYYFNKYYTTDTGIAQRGLSRPEFVYYFQKLVFVKSS